MGTKKLVLGFEIFKFELGLVSTVSSFLYVLFGFMRENYTNEVFINLKN